jgi:predicted DNA-binding transcriptional regulator AlpA
MVDRVLSKADLQERGIAFSKVHLWRLERDGAFPKRVHLSPRHVGWLASEIDAWLTARAAARGGVNAA